MILFDNVVNLYEEKLHEKVSSMTFSKKSLKHKLMVIYAGRIKFKKIEQQLVILDATTFEYQQSILTDKLKAENLKSAMRYAKHYIV